MFIFRNEGAVGSDWTNTYTGSNNGVIVILEQTFDSPWQWIICLLNCIELPLRHIILNIDGETSGPVGFKGPISKTLANSEELPVINFSEIECERISVDESEVSNDQKYLFAI